MKKRKSEHIGEDSNKNMKFLIGAILFGLVLISANLISHKGDEIADTVMAAEKQGLFTYQILSVANTSTDTLSPQEIAVLPEKIQELKNLAIIPKRIVNSLGLLRGKMLSLFKWKPYKTSQLVWR